MMIDINDEKFWDILFDEACVEGEQGTRIYERLKQIVCDEEVLAAVEKQKVKKPYYEGDGHSNGELVYDTWICPDCGEYYETECDDYKYCPECGQKIDWSEEE